MTPEIKVPPLRVGQTADNLSQKPAAFIYSTPTPLDSQDTRKAQPTESPVTPNLSGYGQTKEIESPGKNLKAQQKGNPATALTNEESEVWESGTVNRAGKEYLKILEQALSEATIIMDTNRRSFVKGFIAGVQWRRNLTSALLKTRYTPMESKRENLQ